MIHKLLTKLFWTIILSIGIGVFAGGGLSLYEDWLVKKDVVDVEVVPLNQVRAEPIKDSVPRRIEIADLSIDMEVVPGLVKNDKWQVSETKANYLVGSGVVGSSSNVVIYAHRRPSMFINLPKAKIGDQIVVSAKDLKAVYEVFEFYETEVEDTQILEDVGEPILTLYTCYRWDDSSRYVVKAKLISQQATSLLGIIELRGGD